VNPLDLLRRHDKDGLLQFLNRARHGDQSTRPGLEQLLRDPLQGPLLRQRFGDLAAHLGRQFLSLFAQGNLVVEAAALDQLTVQRAELAGPGATPLERLLVERMLLCWVQVCCADALVARALREGWTGSERYERSQSRAQARLLEALKGLAVLRKLQRPAPTPLELATRPVTERSVPDPVHSRGRAGVPGVPAAN
jgi:hypothetical protein